MGSKGYIPEELTATTTAVAWTISCNDDTDLNSVCLSIGVAPTSAGSVTLTLDSVEGAAYDTVLAAVSAVGATSIAFTDVGRFAEGDKILVSYANPDSRSITGVAELNKKRT